jgi:hypothetical protein
VIDSQAQFPPAPSPEFWPTQRALTYSFAPPGMIAAQRLAAVRPSLMGGAAFPVTVLTGVTLAATEALGPAPVLTTYAVLLSGENTIACGP